MGYIQLNLSAISYSEGTETLEKKSWVKRQITDFFDILIGYKASALKSRWLSKHTWLEKSFSKNVLLNTLYLLHCFFIILLKVF